MSNLRRLILALVTIAGFAPAAFAQAPPPVPALPDTERRTAYSISASTCQCTVNFALYGDSTDFQNWIEVYLNGVRVNYNDPTFGWTITSQSTQPLSNLPRPITDALLTFTSAQTGTVQIVGARRPRRVSQFSENAGVPARALNQALTDIIAQNRELWDKTNDFTGRALVSQPGVTLGLMPVPSVCQNGFLGFDATGLIPVCRSSSGPGNVTLPVVSGNFPSFSGTLGLLADSGVPSSAGAATFGGNPTASPGALRYFTLQSLANLATPNQALDLIPIWDHATGLLKNVIPSALGTAGNTPHTQDFLSGAGFTAGVTTALTLSSSPASSDLLFIAFDGIWQNANTWSLSGAVVTFSAVIPLNTQVVEAKWSTSTTLSGVNSITVSPSTLNGAITLLPGRGTSITPSGQNITIGNSVQTVSIKDFGAKCDAIFASNQNFAGVPATNITINSGSPNLLSTGSSFTSTAVDGGKSIWVPGAGAAGAGLSTTILTVTDATHVVLAANASTTVTAFPVTNANPLVYGTDDTTAIQAAMTATPVGGVLDIPGSVTGCLIKRQGANNYALLQDHPFSIQGHGHFSNLMTDPSIPSTVDDILIQAGAYAWDNMTWQDFSVGDMPSFIPSTFLMYPRHGRRGIWWSASGSGFLAPNMHGLMIGESGNDHSFYLDGPATSHALITSNRIFGGIRLDSVADSNRIVRNDFRGFSIYGGVIDTPLAGMFEFVGNNVTWAGGLRIESGSQPTVSHNYFEEGAVTSESNNAMVDFNGAIGTIQDPHFTDNIVNATTSTTSTPVRYSNSVRGIFGGNTVTTTNARTGVTSVNTLSCSAPNNFAGPVSPHFSTALASPNPFSC